MESILRRAREFLFAAQWKDINARFFVRFLAPCLAQDLVCQDEVERPQRHEPGVVFGSEGAPQEESSPSQAGCKHHQPDHYSGDFGQLVNRG
jgi:hypothetical protein